jgi:ATP:corrinoid adenosyltransferase
MVESSPILEAKNVEVKRGGTTILNVPSLSISKGEILSLIGPNGAGKTTNALGLALRSIGHRHTVVIIQFLKWWKNTGEFRIKKMLAPYYEIHQFGRKGWIGLSNLGEQDREPAQKALKFAEKIVKEKKPNIKGITHNIMRFIDCC